MCFSQAWTFGIAEKKEYHWNASKKCVNSSTLCKEIRQPLSTPVKSQHISFRSTVQASQPKNLNYAVFQSLLSCFFWHFAQSSWIRVHTCEELCWNCRNKGICWNPISQIICSTPYLRGHVPDANTSSCKQLDTVSSCWDNAVADLWYQFCCLKQLISAKGRPWCSNGGKLIINGNLSWSLWV